MFGLPLLDIIVIVVYFLAMIGIGFWSMRRIKTQEDYFIGGRRFGKVIQIFANFGQATSSDTGPSVATTTYNNGAAGVWSSLLMLFSTPFFWFTAPWYRRMRVITLADFYSERYHSKALGGVYATISSVGLCILLSLGFITLTKTVLAMTPKTVSEMTVAERAEYAQAQRLDDLKERNYTSLSPAEKQELDRLQVIRPRKNFSHINKYILIFSIVAVVCIYSIAGGLEAAFLSDMVQGIFILLLSVMLIPFSMVAINHKYGTSGVMGAFKALHAQKSASFFEIFGSPHNIDFTWYYILALAVMALFNASAQANSMVAPASARNEYIARFGMTFGMYLKRFATVLWGLTAMFAVLLFARKINDPDLLWGYASRELLGPLGLGLVGLMIAALMAALMSTADMMMITISGLLTRNVYKQLVRGKSEKHYVFVGRCLGAVAVLGAAIMTLFSDSLLGALKLWWEFGVIFSAAMWMGILWKKTSCVAAWFQIISALVLFFLIPIFLPVFFPSLRINKYLTTRTAGRVIVRHYAKATPEDVRQRLKEISIYEHLPLSKRKLVQKPEPVILGKPWSQVYKLPRQAIFWTKGLKLVKAKDGSCYYEGQGRLNIFLVLADKLGLDLEHKPHAFNETLRIVIRTFLPFLILIMMSYLFKQSDGEKKAVERLAVRMLTPVAATPEEDKAEVELSYNNPTRFNHRKLLGEHSAWQLQKWDKEDTWGFAANIAILVGIIGCLYFVVNLGST